MSAPIIRERANGPLISPSGGSYKSCLAFNNYCSVCYHTHPHTFTYVRCNTFSVHLTADRFTFPFLVIPTDTMWLQIDRAFNLDKHHFELAARSNIKLQVWPPLVLVALLAASLAVLAGPSPAAALHSSLSNFPGSSDTARDEQHQIIKYDLVDIDVISLLSDSAPDPKSLDNGATSGVELQSRRRKLRQASVAAYQQQQQQPAAVFEMGSFDAPLISIALTHVPTAGTRSRKYFAYWRAYTSNQTRSAATFDLDTRKAALITTGYDQFCNGPIVLADGSIALLGGYNEPKNKLQADGRKAISVCSALSYQAPDNVAYGVMIVLCPLGVHMRNDNLAQRGSAAYDYGRVHLLCRTRTQLRKHTSLARGLPSKTCVHMHTWHTSHQFAYIMSQYCFSLIRLYFLQTYNESTKQLQKVGSMSFPRWYPTPCMVQGNKVLIVGGTAKADVGPPIPVAELWDPLNPGRPTSSVPLPPTFKNVAWNNWYPFIVLLPGGEVLWWGDRGGSITNKDWKEIYKLPDLPRAFPYRTMYWYTSSIILNAMKPDPQSGEYKNFSMTIFGGAPDGAKQKTPASPLSARLDMYYCGNKICDNGWVVENMAGQKRVMATTTVLPNGKVLVHGGGQAGVAGWKKGQNGYQGILPAYQDLIYDPDAPLGSRYSTSATVGIVRMYHSSSCLDLSGKVMSAGCETCGMTGNLAGNLPSSVSRSPHGDLDYRISFAVPAEIAPPVERPVIRTAPKVILRGRVFTVGYKYGGRITGATLAAPCANTHSINMNQRVVFLPSAAHAGYYQLFLLGANTATGRTFSEGVWIYLADE
ncbi:hypothetical protein VOLCADRAFT_94428 [Volvox carteri f. nagariensis]|uniref:Uncharacterized protein n=1 Tax=Volvox carteri f. nagariensis TaxID=3068 RepID=D8U4S2_VOLCA|nr:uncharacterized protein VOLCADRAFT_94428 [Volvox carteri f. nagariensis]EFJ45324.1 hypothetical protein VOLCADRAFT_94428 [Volvox carteri f. nagariensis]|eukprot:XP_002953700.1 hypothetical protein VOLCADRAFT_94428 [Volvox carteri f. nagariensis]